MNEQNPAIIVTSDQQNAIEDIMEKFESLQNRILNAVFQEDILPVSGLSPSVQELLLLAVADIKLLENIVEGTGANLRSISMFRKCNDELEQLREELVQAVVDSLGVDREIVVPTTIKVVTRDLELIETVLVRLETNLASVMAAREK